MLVLMGNALAQLAVRRLLLLVLVVLVVMGLVMML
jgi:hypothetical protein